MNGRIEFTGGMMNVPNKELLIDDPVLWVARQLVKKDWHIEDEQHRFRDELLDIQEEHASRMQRIYENHSETLGRAFDLLKSFNDDVDWELITKLAIEKIKRGELEVLEK